MKSLYDRELLLPLIKELIKEHPEYSHSQIAEKLGDNIHPWVVQEIISSNPDLGYKNKNDRKYTKEIKILEDYLKLHPDARSKELGNLIGLEEKAVLRLMRYYKIPYKYFGKKGTDSIVDITNPEVIEKIRHYVYETDLTQEQIGEKLGVSGCTMSTIIRKLGFDDISVGGREIDWFKPGLKKKIQDLIDKGLSTLQMEPLLGMTHCSISKGIKILGLDYKSPKPESTEWTDEMVNELTKYINDKEYDVIEISNKMGLTKSVVYNEIKRLGLHYDIKEVHQTKYDKYFDMYVNQELPIEEISDLTGAAYNTIYRVLLKEFKKRGLDERLGNSRGEKLIVKSLKKLGIPFIREKFYKGVADQYKAYIRIDFMVEIEGTTYWIEYNGEQHYNSMCRFYRGNRGDLDSFEKQTGRDRCVREYAKENGIILLEIPYTITSYKEITKILQDVLLSRVDPETIDKLKINIK